MRYASLTLLILLTAAGSTRAGDDELDQLDDEYQAAYHKWVTSLQKASKGDGEMIDMSKMPPHPAKKFKNRYKAYAEKHSGKPEAMRPLFTVIEMTSQAGVTTVDGQGDDDANWAIDELTKHHAADANLGDFIDKLQYASYAVSSRRLSKFYKAVIEKNPDNEVKATAKFGLAMYYWQGSGLGMFGRAPQKDKAVELLRDLEKNFKDTKAGAQAAGYIFEVNNLQIGMKAPDIEGADANGNTIKLSQFKGQVVVLDFWGFW